MSKEQIGVAAKLLSDAADSIEEWAAYASPYFQDKHDLQGDLAHYRGEAEKLAVVAAQLEKAPELRANEQKLIDDKFELQKQVQALQADNELLREKANHAEKWQGIALAKHGDGRTVQQVKRCYQGVHQPA